MLFQLLVSTHLVFTHLVLTHSLTYSSYSPRTHSYSCFPVGSSPVSLARTLRIIFLLLLVLSIAIRAYLYDFESLNLFKLGEYGHFGMLSTDSSRHWMETHYGHTWYTENTFNKKSMYYFNNMYATSHTR